MGWSSRRRHLDHLGELRIESGSGEIAERVVSKHCDLFSPLDGTGRLFFFDGSAEPPSIRRELDSITIQIEERKILRGLRKVTIRLGFRDPEGQLTLFRTDGDVQRVFRFVRTYLAARYLADLPEVSVTSTDGEQFEWPPSIDDQEAIAALLPDSDV